MAVEAIGIITILVKVSIPVVAVVVTAGAVPAEVDFKVEVMVVAAISTETMMIVVSLTESIFEIIIIVYF